MCLSRVTNDVDLIGQTMNQSLGTLVSAITMFLGSLIMMFYTNWIMAISAIVSTILGFALMTVHHLKISKILRSAAKRAWITERTY